MASEQPWGLQCSERGVCAQHGRSVLRRMSMVSAVSFIFNPVNLTDQLYYRNSVGTVEHFSSGLIPLLLAQPPPAIIPSVLLPNDLFLPWKSDRRVLLPIIFSDAHCPPLSQSALDRLPRPLWAALLLSPSITCYWIPAIFTSTHFSHHSHLIAFTHDFICSSALSFQLQPFTPMWSLPGHPDAKAGYVPPLDSCAYLVYYPALKNRVWHTATVHTQIVARWMIKWRIGSLILPCF